MEPEIADVLNGLTLAEDDHTDKIDYFSVLPDEMILKIFENLPAKSLGRCAAVCHRWRRLAYDENLWQDETVDLRLGKEISIFEISHILQLGVRKLLSRRATIPDPDSWENIFPDNFKSKLKWLDLSRCQISTKAIFLILNHTGHLESLTLEFCPLDQDCFEAIGKNKNLKILNLVNCIKSMSTQEIEAVFREKPSLEVLNLTNCDLKTEVLDVLVASLPPTLLRLLLGNGHGRLQDRHVLDIVHNCPDLIVFDIDGHFDLSDLSYDALDNLNLDIDAADRGLRECQLDYGLSDSDEHDYSYDEYEYDSSENDYELGFDLGI